MDISKIVLTKEESTAFSKFLRSDQAELTIDEYKILLHKGLINDTIGGSSGWFDNLPEIGVCKISDLGKDLRALQSLRKKEASQSSRRYWITTIIAIIALIKAFMPEIAATAAWLSKLLGQQ